jgi:anoctamin-1
LFVGKVESIARREKFENNLEEDGLELERESVDKVHFVKIHAPREVLRRYAEILRLRLPMKQVHIFTSHSTKHFTSEDILRVS